MNTRQLNMDGFASGQIGSKLWLCQELEKILKNESDISQNIHLIGGWYGLLAFMLRTRGSFPIKQILNIDQDDDACEISQKINNLWLWRDSSFKSLNLDANTLDNNFFTTHNPTLIINTSVEHMPNKNWFEAVPPGTRVVLQSCNMKHPDHFVLCFSSQDLASAFPLSHLEFEGELFFDYNNENSFTRFMVIGKK